MGEQAACDQLQVVEQFAGRGVAVGTVTRASGAKLSQLPTRE